MQAPLSELRKFFLQFLLCFSLTSISKADAVVLSTLHTLRSYQEASEALQSQLPEAAIPLLQECLEVTKNDLECQRFLLIRIAQAQISAKLPELAIQSLSDPRLRQEAECHFWRGLAQAQLSHFEKAQNAFLHSLELQNLDPQLRELAISKLALLNLQFKDLDTAQYWTNQLPQELDATALLRIEILLAKQDSAAALDSLNRLEARNSERLQKTTAYLRARCLLGLNQIAPLQKTLPDLEKSEPFVGAALLIKFSALLQTGQYEEAYDLSLDALSNPQLQSHAPFFLASLEDSTKEPSLEFYDHLDRWAQSSHPDLSAAALYTKAIFQHRVISTIPAAFNTMGILLKQWPQHPIALRAKLALAFWYWKANDLHSSKAILASIPKPFNSSIAEQIQFLKGLLCAEKQSAKAQQIFENLVRSTSSKELATAAGWNAQLLDLQENHPIDQIQVSTPSDRALLSEENNIEAARIGKANALPALEAQMKERPSPRLALALASLHLQATPPAISKASHYLARYDTNSLEPALQESHLSLRLHAAQLNTNWKSCIELADTFLNKFPQSQRRPLILLQKAQALFHLKSFNQAQIELSQLSELEALPQLSRANASFLAAECARRTPNDASQQQAILLYERASKLDPSLTDLAEFRCVDILSRLQNSLPQAKHRLQQLTQSTNPSSRYKALLKLASLERQESPPNTTTLSKIIKDETTPIIWKQRALFQQAVWAESKNNLPEAIANYYAIIALVAKPAPEHETWILFEESGLNLIRLLIQDKRTEAAQLVANKLLNANTSRREEILQLINQLK